MWWRRGWGGSHITAPLERQFTIKSAGQQKFYWFKTWIIHCTLYQEAFLHFSGFGKSADSEEAPTEEKSLRLSLEPTSDVPFICRSQREHSLLQEMVTKAKASPRLSLYGSVCASANGNWVTGYAVADQRLF